MKQYLSQFLNKKCKNYIESHMWFSILVQGSAVGNVDWYIQQLHLYVSLEPEQCVWACLRKSWNLFRNSVGPTTSLWHTPICKRDISHEIIVQILDCITNDLWSIYVNPTLVILEYSLSDTNFCEVDHNSIGWLQCFKNCHRIKAFIFSGEAVYGHVCTRRSTPPERWSHIIQPSWCLQHRQNGTFL